MFTSPGCLNRKRIEINHFTCPPGGTKRNCFNLEDRRFWPDVRKNFLIYREARAQLRTFQKRLGKHLQGLRQEQLFCTRPGTWPKQSFEIFVFGFVVYSVLTINS